MKHKILFIDDEPAILRSVTRLLRKEDFEVQTSDNPEEILKLVSEESVSVVVSDQRMPKMTGTDLLAKVKAISPGTIRILLTGYAEIGAVISAINEGSVFRYIAKPWQDEDLRVVLRQAISQFQLIEENTRLQVLTQKQNQELKELNQGLEARVEERTQKVQELNKELQKGFLGSIQLVDRLANLHNSGIGAHAKRVAKLCIPVAKSLGIDGRDLFDLQVSALLHDIGKVGVSEEILNKKLEDLTPDEKKKLRKHAELGETLVSEIPGLGEASRYVRHHHEHFNGKGYPSGLSGESIPLGSRIISVVDAYDKILNAEETYSAESQNRAVEFLDENINQLFDPKVVDALKEFLEHTQDKEMEVGLDELRIGMQLSRTVKNAEGKSILAKGSVLKESTLEKVRNWLEKDLLVDSIYVFRVPDQPGPKVTDGKVGWE